MGYYGRGDYYRRGDYMRRGDPGIFSFLGGVARTVSHFLPGPLGTIAGAVGSILSPAQTQASSAGPLSGPPPAALLSGGPSMSIVAPQSAGLINIGTSGPPPAGLLNIGTVQGRGGPGHAGYHIEKRGKHAGQWIKNRHMRVTNPKALRRALRRAKGFEHLARRVLQITSPRHRVKGFRFKRRRRAA